MQKRFAKIINEMRGLVNENWSAPVFKSASAIEPSPVIEPSRRQRILVAVSGGVDSMVMAHLFLQTLQKEDFALAHCNFNLRGQESNSDQALVEAWANEHGLRLHLASFDTETYAKEHSLSIEMAARELRYRWFANVCRENGYVATAVAHNANDNAETLILNLLRGTGMDGLTGMSPVSDFPLSDCQGIRLIRPLIEFTRKQIEGYAFAWDIEYHTDSTNLLSDYKRNRIRNEVFPQFARINPSFVATLCNDMEYFADAGEIVRTWCRNQQERVVSKISGVFGDGISINLDALFATGHWKYLLYQILSPYGFNSSVLSSINSLLSSSRTVSGKRFESDTHVLITGRGEMSLYGKASVGPLAGATAADSSSIMPVRCDGTYHFNGRTFKIKTIRWSADMSLKQPDGVVVLDADKLSFPFVLRPWRAGDWMVPLGMRGRKLLSDMFTDLKYSAADKASAVLLVDVHVSGEAHSGHCAALLSRRIDKSYRITTSTVNALRIEEIPAQETFPGYYDSPDLPLSKF